MNQRKSRRWVSYLLSAFWWTVHGAVLAIVGMMAWSLGHAWELPEPLPQGGVVVIVAPTVFAAGAISVWRTRETGAFIGFAASAVIFSAVRVYTVFIFIVWIVAQQPALTVSRLPAEPPTTNAPAPGSDVRDWQRRMTVTTDKGKRLAPEPPRDNAKDGSQPERPTIATFPSRPAAILAAALGLEQTKFDVMLSVVMAAVFELAISEPSRGPWILGPPETSRPTTQTEALSMALQLIGLMTLMQGMTSPSAREAPQRSPPEAKPDPPAPAPARPNPVVGNGSPAPVPHSTRRPRVPEQDRAHALLQLLQQSQRGGLPKFGC